MGAERRLLRYDGLDFVAPLPPVGAAVDGDLDLHLCRRHVRRDECM